MSITSSLDYLESRAQALARDARKSDPTAVERILTHHPEWRRFWRSRKTFGFSDARIVLAREHGFASWTELIDALQRGDAIRRNPSEGNPYFEMVDKFQIKEERIRWASIMSALPGRMGKANRGKPVSKEKLEALIWGLEHDNAVVRWMCLEHLDAHPDPSAIPHIVRRLDDPVPRVRWHAVHALACDACKDGASFLSFDVLDRLRHAAAADASQRVRRYAAQVLAERCSVA
jgi:hypothetical protein